MRWWGRKAGAAPRPALLRGFGVANWPVVGEPSWPRSYEAQVRDAFLANPVAQRAVRLVAEGVASASVYAEVGVGGGPPPPPSAVPLPLPGSILTAALLETVAAQLLLHGKPWPL